MFPSSRGGLSHDYTGRNDSSFFFSLYVFPPSFLTRIPRTSREAENLLSKLLNVSYPRFMVLESAMSFSDGIPAWCFWVEEVIRYIGEEGDEPNVIIK